MKALLALCLVSAPAWAASLDFMPIPPGEFIMGATDETAALFELPDGDASLIADERPAHRVRIMRGFELARTETTQGQWFDLMKTRPGPAAFWTRHDWRELPVVSVSWNDAQRFVAALNKRENTTRYRLPTEAEWEYAARAGSAGNRPFSDTELAAHAWYLGNSGDVPHPVGRLAANAWGLHDMLGNAWEWVADRYQPDYYANSPHADPRGPSAGERRVRRGGSYHCAPHLVRVNYRAADTPDTRYSVIGFRVLRESRRK
ncbi:MAG: formylglycine-generating enzyme family protein [Pseudomonadota bacterium]